MLAGGGTEDGGSGTDGEGDDTSDGGGDGGGRDGSGGDGGDGQSTVERAITVVSVVFTLAVVGVLVWQALTAPAGAQPRVSVVETGPAPGGGVGVTVELVNRGSVGVDAVTVELDCESPPPELTFQHVPASGRREGTVVCPAGTTAPNASIATWQQA